jgi:hypothetical protein
MTSIDERLLESKMTQIERARAWSPRVISKFETLIRSEDEVGLWRANPLAFALYTAPDVRELLAGHDVAEFDAPLSGVEGNARVYRVTSRASSRPDHES